MVASETLQVVGNGTSIPSFLAEPSQAAGVAPAVIILHDWWGLTDHIRDVGRRFAAAGFVACAPALYARQGSKATTDPAEAAALMGAVSSQWVLRDLNAVAQSLKRRPTVDSHRIGIVGFSMGGTFALTQACHNSDLKAAVMFYGKIPPPESFKYVLCPLLYHWAEQDGWIPARDVEQLRDGLAAAQRPCEIVRYPGCQHGFFNERHPEVYNKDAANRAWQKTLAFLAQHVR